MSELNLSFDDKAANLTTLDITLRLNLEQRLSEQFYQSCDRITRTLLGQCQWLMAIETSGLVLIVICPTVRSYWHMLSAITQLGSRLERLSQESRIRIHPPGSKGRPMEFSIQDLPNYQDFC